MPKIKRAQLTAIVAEQHNGYVTQRFRICGDKPPEAVVEFTTLDELRSQALDFARDNLDATLATDHSDAPGTKRGVYVSLHCLETRKPPGWKKMPPIYYWPHEDTDDKVVSLNVQATNDAGNIPGDLLALLDDAPPAAAPAAAPGNIFSFLPDAPAPAKPAPPAKPLTNAQRIALGLASVDRLAQAGFLGGPQLQTVRDFIRKSEDSDFFIDKMAEIEATIAAMPATHGTVGEPTAHLHYFSASSDWWILEKDLGSPDDAANGVPPQSQAYGFVYLNRDAIDAETGYISLPALLRTNRVELDFHFQPTTLAELQAKITPEPDTLDPEERAAVDAFDSAGPAAPIKGTAPDEPEPGSLHIRITRAEGLTEECYTICLASYDDATQALRHWGTTAPEHGHGYDKCDVVVTFPDGESYSYRYDLNRDGSDSGDGCDFRTNLRNRLGFYANRWCPPHMSEEKYEEMKRIHLSTHPDNVEACAKLLDTHLADTLDPAP